MGIIQNTRLDTAMVLRVSAVICKTAIYSNPISKTLDTLVDQSHFILILKINTRSSTIGSNDKKKCL